MIEHKDRGSWKYQITPERSMMGDTKGFIPFVMAHEPIEKAKCSHYD